MTQRETLVRPAAAPVVGAMLFGAHVAGPASLVSSTLFWLTAAGIIMASLTLSNQPYRLPSPAVQLTRRHGGRRR